MGLDVVRTNVEKLKGQVQMTSRPDGAVSSSPFPLPSLPFRHF